jgi:hypothetical protein
MQDPTQPTNPHHPDAAAFAAQLDGLPASWEARPHRGRGKIRRTRRDIVRIGPTTVSVIDHSTVGTTEYMHQWLLDFTAPGHLSPTDWVNASRVFYGRAVPGCECLPSMPWPPVPA